MPTIYDVARTAKVSPKTVSRVLNGDGPVRIQTRDAVQSAIDTLGYVPSSAARSMRSQRTGLIGVITGALSGAPADIGQAGLPELLIVQAAQRAFEGTRFTIMIADTGGRADRVPHLLSTFAEHRVEGVIYVAERHSHVEMPNLAPGFRMVLANCTEKCANARLPAVVPDDEAGQRSLTAWTLAQGHRRIGYLTFSHRFLATRLRLDGHRNALTAAGVADDPTLIAEVGEDADSMDAAVHALMDLPDPPSCILCGNDAMAMRLYGVLRSMGLSVPEDVSVAGYDDHRAISEMLYPPLTTAALPYEAMGAEAARILRDMIEGEPIPVGPALVEGGVVPRSSVLAKDETFQGRKT
ncbi:LacI family DNA-binding transcriptional regulator [Jannaschia sp.]|nr:LacI family DNA-binding transcriptional regulator [Jannaschia sp.]